MAVEKFHLLDTDTSLLITLRFTARDQYDLLVAAYRQPRPTYAKLAEELQIPINTVRSKLSRAKSKILAWRKIAMEKT